MYKIQLLADFDQNQLKPLDKKHFEIAKEAADALMIRSGEIEANALTNSLLAIARAGVGVNTIDVEAATQNGTIVMNTPGQNANAVKELVLASLFLTARPIFQAAEMVEGLESNDLLTTAEEKRADFIGQELQGKTVGLLGIGAIGSLVAEACYELGMDVLGYARNDPESEIMRFASLETILDEADFIVVLLPLSENTEHLLSKKEFQRMKSTAYVLNFGRGEIVDSLAVLEAIEKEQLAGYITDFPENELQGQKKILQLPHIGGTTEEALSDSGAAAAKALKAFLLYGTVKDSVNFPAAKLPFRGEHRFTFFYENQPKMWQKIIEAVSNLQLEIVDMISNRKGEFIYVIMDVEAADKEKLTRAAEALQQLEAMKRIRVLTQPHQ
ncbi:NAD(P)-dependent oxidoreductase [Candidatus Enterococcus ferrettii]|uniref:D-3-phosphoglycerate dehydrogenase n=1 Tax=Candidatus Enterococcus ferrettii TaxID=2815324 RepID=A0ABV0ERI6_9ENTE|nr:NAD(P)-dependent oxidoreductase [Enterococcus sp. 665A]MBO1342024.1 hydroxyacid dehydrogenase [Enterococcus sp. 665A]